MEIQEICKKSINLEALQVDESVMGKINAFSLKNLTTDDVFAFRVLACSNEVDRDLESFTVAALQDMAKQYKGKPMIFDHSGSARGQIARVFDSEVRTDESKKTLLGEDYTVLILSAYIPRIEKNEGFISEIESGIKKEVSVAMRAKKAICSVCGKEVKGWPLSCGHEQGKKYNEKICVRRLDGAEDVYELSFVAVPAQRDAGVIKHAQRKDEFANQEPKQATEQKNTVFNGFLKFLKN